MTLSKQDIGVFIREFEKDLAALKMAFDALQRRRAEVEGTGQEEYFTKSSMFQASFHSLNAAICSTEGIIEDLKQNLKTAPDRPALELVKGERHGT